MPTYQYACVDCGHDFEAFQSFTDDALTECPQCGGRLRKVFNSVGIVFKGSGFYRTDSREKGGSSSAPREKSSEKSGDKGSEKSSSEGAKSESSSSKTDSAKTSSSSGSDKGSSSSGSSSTAGSAA